MVWSAMRLRSAYTSHVSSEVQCPNMSLPILSGKHPKELVDSTNSIQFPLSTIYRKIIVFVSSIVNIHSNFNSLHPLAVVS